VQQPTKTFCNNLHFYSATFCKKGLQKTLYQFLAGNGCVFHEWQEPFSGFVHFASAGRGKEVEILAGPVEVFHEGMDDIGSSVIPDRESDKNGIKGIDVF
jgi:hypothetical protein